MKLRVSRFAIGLLLITVAGLGLRIVYIATWAPHDVEELGGDAWYYHEAANLFAEGKGFIDPYRYTFGSSDNVTLADGQTIVVTTPVGHEEPTAGHPPAYVVFLGVIAWFGGRSLLIQQVASALLGVASIIVAGFLGRSLRSNRVGLIAAALVAGYANIWINDGLIMSETIAVLFTLIVTFFGLRFWRQPSKLNAVIFGVGGALAALTRVELLLFLPIIAAVALWKAPISWSDRVFRYAIAGFSCCIILAPWVIRNNLVMNERITLSDGLGTVMVQANCDATYYGEHIGFWNLDCGAPQPFGPNGELLDESQRDVVVRDRASGYIAAHTKRLVTVVVPARVGRMLGFYQPLEQIRIDVIEDRPWFPAWLGFWQYVILAPMAIGGAVIQWRRKQPVLVIGLWMVLATFTAATAFGMTRYRIGAEVSIVLFAAITFDALWSRFRPAPADQNENISLVPAEVNEA